MHNTAVLVLALRMINGVHDTFTMRCVHDCIYLSLCMCCARYGAREGGARGGEMGEALPGFRRRTHMPVANRFSQAASYTRTWGHGDMLSYSRKIKLTSRLVRESLLTAASYISVIEARALRIHSASSGFVVLRTRRVERRPVWGCSYKPRENYATFDQGLCMRVRSSQCPAVRAICQVSIPHVEAVELYCTCLIIKARRVRRL
jgi:hypothetical protein